MRYGRRSCGFLYSQRRGNQGYLCRRCHTVTIPENIVEIKSSFWRNYHLSEEIGNRDRGNIDAQGFTNVFDTSNIETSPTQKIHRVYLVENVKIGKPAFAIHRHF